MHIMVSGKNNRITSSSDALFLLVFDQTTLLSWAVGYLGEGVSVFSGTGGMSDLTYSWHYIWLPRFIKPYSVI